MRERARLFTVIMATPNGAVEAEIWAETPQLACAAAESAAGTNARAVHYTMEADVLGRCDRCSGFIESQERYQRVRGVVRCADCL